MGLEARTQTQLRSIASQLHTDGVERVFITRGEQGVFYSTRDTQDVAEPLSVKRKIRSTGGAGDAFLAGLAYAWLQGWALDKSVQFALAAADITLSSPATSSPALSLTAVNRVMDERHAG